MKQITPFLLLTALLGSLTLAQAEALLFVSDGSTLSSLNPTNAAILSTQTLSSSGLRAMTFSSSGILYGLFTQDLDARLAVIDPTSGNVSFLAFSTGLFVPSGLAFDSTGSLYGLFDDQIYGLNASTGAAASSPSACNITGQSLAFGAEPSGRFLSGLRVNQAPLDNCASSGSGSSSGSSSGSGSSANTGSGGPALNNLRAFAIASGISFAIGQITDGSQTLVTFDGTTFAPSPVLTQRGALAPGVSSIAAMDAPSFVPEPGSMLLMGLGIGGMVLFRRYR